MLHSCRRFHSEINFYPPEGVLSQDREQPGSHVGDQRQLCLAYFHLDALHLQEPGSMLVERTPALCAHTPSRIAVATPPPPEHPRCGGVSKISPSPPLHNFCIMLASYCSVSSTTLLQIYVPLLVVYPAYALTSRAILPIFDIPCYTLT